MSKHIINIFVTNENYLCTVTLITILGVVNCRHLPEKKKFKEEWVENCVNRHSGNCVVWHHCKKECTCLSTSICNKRTIFQMN